MASQDRSTRDRVVDWEKLMQRLVDSPQSFDFFHLLRRIECLHPTLPRLGQALRPSQEPLRLTQQPSLDFPASTLAAFAPGTDERTAPRLAVNFLGLWGPQGALPLHLTEYVQERWREKRDRTLVRFLDIFHHRMLTLYYRAWADTQPTVARDRAEADSFHKYLGALFGIGLPSLMESDDLPDRSKLYFAGHLGCQTRHPEGLESILNAYFALPFQVFEFIGRWIEMPTNGVCRLGKGQDNGTLGMTAVIGAEVWDCQHNFRLRVGPVNFVDYERLLPGGATLSRLVAWVRNYLGDILAWDVKLVLKREEVPALQLGKRGQLGWTSWLGARQSTNDAEDLILQPHVTMAIGSATGTTMQSTK